MKNKEKYADEILNAFVHTEKNCGFRKKYVLKNDICDNIDCRECNKLTEEWLKQEHISLKTRQSEFLKMFPTTKLRNGIVNIFPCNVDKSINDKNCIGDCDKCRKDFWLEEID